MEKAKIGVEILTGWDYRYDKEKPEGAVMEAWEFAIGTYMHEVKISNVRLRRGLLAYTGAEHFLYNSVAKWAKEEETYEDYCYVYALDAKTAVKS